MTAVAVTQELDLGIEELDELVEPGIGEWLIGVGAGMLVGLAVVAVAT